MRMVLNNMISIESMFLARLQSHAMIKIIKLLPAWFLTLSGSVWDPNQNLKPIKSDQQPICVPHRFENLLKLDARRYHSQNWAHHWPNSSQIKVSVVNIWRWQIKLSIQQLQNISLVSMVHQIHSQVQESPQSAHTMTIMNLAHTMATGKRHYFQTSDIIIKWEMVSLKFTLQRLVLNKSRFPIGWPVSVFVKTIKGRNGKRWKNSRLRSSRYKRILWGSMYCYGHDGFRSMQGRFHTTRISSLETSTRSLIINLAEPNGAIWLVKSALQSVTLGIKSHKLCDIDRPLNQKHKLYIL